MNENKIPILYLFFLRKDTIVKSFQSVREYMPKDLYVASDGPRGNKPEDKGKIKEARAEIEKMIDWECKVHYLYRDTNLGCAKAVSGAIDWFFEHVEFGAIIEEDCLVSTDFFKMCETLLPQFSANEKVMQLSSQNYLTQRKPNELIVSNSFLIWGWATWRNKWKLMDMSMSKWTEYNKLKSIRKFGFFRGIMMNYYWNRIYQNPDKSSSWATRWFFAITYQDGLILCPGENLCINLGFTGDDSTHYHSSSLVTYPNLKIGKIEQPFNPTKLQVDFTYHMEETFDFYRIRIIGIINKILNK